MQIEVKEELAANQLLGGTQAAEKRKTWLKTIRYYHYYYWLLLLGLIYFLIFKYIPMGGIVIAFKDYKLMAGIFASPWVGFKWFHMLFAANDFWTALRNTILISFYKLAFGFPAPILLALLLNEVVSTAYKRTIQTIVYFPHFLSWVILGGMMFTIFSPSTGILTLFGIHKSPFMQPEHFRALLVQQVGMAKTQERLHTRFSGICQSRITRRMVGRRNPSSWKSQG